MVSNIRIHMNITRTALAKTLNVIGATLVGLYLFFRSKER